MWNVKYIAGEQEKNKFVAELKLKKIKYVAKISIQDVYEIRFKEEKK
jgi:hypothetical protein